MSQATRTPNWPRSRFGEQLQRELERHPHIKSLKRLGRELNPAKPEIGRRVLTRWVSPDGVKPTAASRALVAAALGIDPSAFADDEDDEEDSEVADLVRALMHRIDRKVEAEVAARLGEPS